MEGLWHVVERSFLVQDPIDTAWLIISPEDLLPIVKSVKETQIGQLSEELSH